MAIPLALPAVVLSTAASLSVVWPSAGARYPYVGRSFTFGSAVPGSTVTVNGQPLALSPSGAFLAMVDFSTGTFELKYTADFFGVIESTSRVVFVEPPVLPTPDEARGLDEGWSQPRADLELEPGQVVTVTVKGPPGMRGRFRVKRLAKNLPLVEEPSGAPGVYVGHYRIRPGDKGKNLYLTVKLKNPRTGRSYKEKLPGRLTVRDPSLTRVAVSSGPVTVVRTGQSGGYHLFLPQGVLLSETGRAQSQVQVALDSHWRAWVDAEKLLPLPEGTPAPLAIVGKDLSVELSTRASRLVIPVSQPVPFELRHSLSPYRIELRFFNAIQRFDRFYFKRDDPVFREVRYQQQSEGVVALEIETRLEQGWGYDAFYEGGNFILEVRWPPPINPEKPLAGRHIMLDAGHSPERGAVGPLGSEERQVNLEIALKTRDLLEKEGAWVYMIRDSTQAVPLADRPGIAWRSKAEVYVSIHSNALPVTQDPFGAPRGFMNFYYHPHSRPLAEALDRSYARHWPLLADNGVLWGDLSVCRATQMPSVLTETAYLILPEQEEILRSAAGQARFARTITDGLKDFFRESARKKR